MRTVAGGRGSAHVPEDACGTCDFRDMTSGLQTIVGRRRYNASMVRGERMLTTAGLLVWVAVGIPVFTAAWPPTEALEWWRVAAWAAFGVSFAACMTGTLGRAHVPRLWVGLQTCAALVLFWATPRAADLELALLVVIAGQLTAFIEPLPATAWAVAQTVVAAVIASRARGAVEVVIMHTSFFAFQLFALGAMLLATSERRARASLARANAELQALHLVLEHESRQAERLRIARELHDSLGHGLTAMALELEAARHHANPDAKPHVDRAQLVSKTLLAEVRDVVSSMRGGAAIDVTTALRALAEHSQQLSIELSLPPSLAVEDTSVAHAVVRAVQEAITNARRHAGASLVRVTITARDGALQLEVRDNGRGAATLGRGLGLQGMRERFEQLGGAFDIRTAPGQGFTIAASVPTGARRD